MTRNIDTYNPKGHLEVWKVYNDGHRELHFSDRNMIVSGMGVGLAYLFSASGSDKVTDYQIRWFQVGVSGPNDYGTSTFKLTGPLSSLSQYGVNSDILVSSLSQIQNGSVVTSQYFASIPFNQIRKVAPNKVQFLLVLSDNTANNLVLNEIGLFMQNPKKLTPAATILVAYKTFSPVEKTDNFSLVFKWTITF